MFMVMNFDGRFMYHSDDNDFWFGDRSESHNFVSFSSHAEASQFVRRMRMSSRYRSFAAFCEVMES